MAAYSNPERIYHWNDDGTFKSVDEPGSREYYVAPNGRLISVDAGFDAVAEFPGVVPATEDDYIRLRREKTERESSVDPAFNRTGPDVATAPREGFFAPRESTEQEAPYLDPDAAFGPTPDMAPEQVQEFNALEPTPEPEPEAPTTYSRDGRDYYFTADGKLASVDAGFDVSEDYPDFVPATEEEVRKYEIQKRSGGFGSQVLTVPETASATVATLISGLDKALNDISPGKVLNKYIPSRPFEEYEPDDYVKPQELAPDAFTPEAIEAREANPTAAFIGAAIPDVAVNLALPGEGLAITAARMAASGMLAEAGDAVIEEHEFDMGRALGIYTPTQLVFETAGNVALKQAARGLGWVKENAPKALDRIVERANKSSVENALRETDPVKRAAGLRRPEVAMRVYAEQQTALDEVIEIIDEKLVDAPERLFTPTALKKSVGSNATAQADVTASVAKKLGAAAEVTDNATVKKALDLVQKAETFSGASQYQAIRLAWKMLDDAAIDSPLVREAFETIETTLGDANTWGRAAKHHAGIIADTAAEAAPGRYSVRDLTAREAIDRKFERARSIAALTGNKALAAAVKKGEKALELAGEVTGARALGGALPDEVDALRKTLDSFPERVPELTEKLNAALEKLDLPETWTVERIEAHIAERAAGSKAAREQLDNMLAEAAKMGETTAAGKAARRKAVDAARKILDEVDAIPEAFKRVRDYDADPTGWLEKGVEWAADKVAGKAARYAAKAAGMAAGYAGGGAPGAAAAFVASEVAEPAIERAVKDTAKKFSGSLRKLLRKHGRTAVGVGALYGANQLANDPDDPSPAAAATIGMLGAPLLFRGRGRPLLGRVADALDRPNPSLWRKSDWREKTIVTYGRGEGESLADAIKKRLKDRAPLSYAELDKHVFYRPYHRTAPEGMKIGNMSARAEFVETPEFKAHKAETERLRAEALAPLRAEIDSAVAALGRDADPAARVAAEDGVLRAVLQDALGVKTRKTREPPINVDAKSRYRKNKKGFDAWAQSAALTREEKDSLHEWQSHLYRTINADLRGGKEAAREEAGRLATRWEGEAGANVQAETDRIVAQVEHTPAHLISLMNKAIAAGQTVPGVVVRGISMPQSEVDRLLAAKTATSQGLMSTTIHRGTTAERFASARAGEFNEVPVMLTIEQRTGVPIGQGEGEITLRPGTKFAVVRAEPQDADGMVTAYLREIEPSTLTPADILKGIAGKIPTEAKIAGGLLAVSELAGDDEDSGALEAGVGVGALALLFGGRGKARLFNEQRILLGKKLPAAVRAVADEHLERNAATIDKLVRWATTAERGPLQRGVFSLRNEIVDKAVAAESAIQALKGNVDAQTTLDRYVKTSIEAKLADAARHLPIPPPTRNARKNVGALLDAEANAVDLTETPLHKRYTDVRVKGTEARFEKSWTALQDQLQKEVAPGLDDLARDYEATNKLAEISNAIDEALGQFDPSHKLKLEMGPGKNAPADDRLMRAAAGDTSVDLDKLEIDIWEAARDNVERKTGRTPSGLDRTPKLGDFIEQRVDWAIASAAQKAREKALKEPTPGLRGRGLAIRQGATDFFHEGWAEDVRHAAKTQHTNPERWRDIKQRAIQRLNSYQVDLPKGQASAIVDDLLDAAVNGDDIERAVEDIARLANEGAEGVRVGQHRRLAETFKRFTETASHDLGFDVDQAIGDYAGDFDYKHINKFVRTGDAFGTTDDLDALEEAAEEVIGSAPAHPHAQMRRDDITRKAERLQVALDYAVVHGYTAPGKTWRGVLMSDDELLALRTSDVAEAKSFMSTSADETYPMQFISSKHQLNKDPGLNKVIFEVQQRSGVPINPGESEVLLRAGSRFRVERINDPDTRAQFRLTEIDADHAYPPSQLGQRIGNKALPWVAGGALILGAATDDDDSGAAAAGVGGLALLMSRHGGRLLLRASEREAQGLRGAFNGAWGKRIGDLQRVRAMSDTAWETLTESERNMLQSYTQTSSHIKRALDNEGRGPLGAREAQWLSNFRSAMQKLEVDEPTQYGPLFRGVDLTAEQLDQIAEGNTLQLSNFSSTTYFPQKAEEFAGSVPYDWQRFGHPPERARMRGLTEPSTPAVIVFDEVDRGSPKFPTALASHPAIDAESEVVLPPGGLFEPVYIEAAPVRNGPPGDKVDIPGVRIYVRQVGTETPPTLAKVTPQGKALMQSPEYLALKDAPDGLSVAEYAGRGGADVYRARNDFRRLANAGLVTIETRGDDLVVKALPTDAPKSGRVLLSLGVGLGIGAKEALGGEEDDGLDPETHAIMVEAEAVRERREQQLDRTREKLAYISNQGRLALSNAARALASPMPPEREVPIMPGVTSSAGMASFVGSADSLRESFERKRATLQLMKQDPMMLVEDLAESFGELQDNAPALHAEVVAQTYRVAEYLESKLPQSRGVSMTRPEGSPATDLEIRQFALYYSAATDPSTVIEDVTNNRARREQVDTLKQVWPDTYAKLQMAVVEQISRSRPTVAQRMRLDLLFDFGPGLDRALSPALAAAYKAARGTEAQQGAPGATPERRTNPSVAGAGALGALALGPGAGPAVG